MSPRDQKLKDYLQKANEFYPDLEPSWVYSMFSGEKQSEPTSGKIEFRGESINELALKEGKVQFAHYTSFKSAMNILNSGNIRLYNCLNLNDANEIKYLLDKSPIDFNDEEIDKFKREHFILSGSLVKEDNNEDFNLWRLYGDNRKGVAFVFEIDEKVKNWRNVYLHNVTYERDNKSTVYDYLKFHKEFNEKHHLFENKPDFFPLLSAGVKNEIWSIEKEFRVVVKNPFDQFWLYPEENHSCNDLISSSLKHEYNDRGMLVSYIELPLHLNDHESQKIFSQHSKGEIDLIDYVPNLKVKKIILGGASPFKDKGDFYEYHQWIIKKLGYDFDIVFSKFTD